MQHTTLSDGLKGGAAQHTVHTLPQEVSEAQLLSHVPRQLLQLSVVGVRHAGETHTKPREGEEENKKQRTVSGLERNHQRRLEAKQVFHDSQTPPFIVWPSQRIVPSESRHVQVVFDDHDISNFKVLVEATGCVCDHDSLHTEQLEDANGKGNLERDMLVT